LFTTYLLYAGKIDYRVYNRLKIVFKKYQNTFIQPNPWMDPTMCISDVTILL